MTCKIKVLKSIERFEKLYDVKFDGFQLGLDVCYLSLTDNKTESNFLVLIPSKIYDLRDKIRCKFEEYNKEDVL